MLKHQPCAYCGSLRSDRARGHVFPSSIYPSTLPDARRITVPECKDCKAIWEDAEPHFRNVLLSIWDPDIPLADSRAEKLWRGFEKVDGVRRVRDLAELFRSSDAAGIERTKIYPAEDPRFSLILRRIVRGLVHWHRLGTAIPDAGVVCDVMRWQIPPAFEPDFSWHTIAPDFVAYAYNHINDKDAHSFWLIRFSKHIVFTGHVSNRSGEA